MLNTVYITSGNKYLSLDGENVVVSENHDEIGRFPLHNIQGIVTFGYSGASPALMGACAKRNIDLAFMTMNGKFLARITGETKGNVTLRKTQYRISDNEEQSIKISRNFILGKVYNSRWVLERAIRDYPMRVDVEKLKTSSKYLQKRLNDIRKCESSASLLGIEGEAASTYFSVINELILQQQNDFIFNGRSRRPPLDAVNALLSFSYSMLAGMCASALEAVGLDSYVGFYHKDRPGRASLALNLMEEFRSVMSDRFVLTLINKRIINKSHFLMKEDGAVLLNDIGRKVFLKSWQEKKQTMIKHPFLGEKIEWGMAPYVQALLLARYLRGDLDEYPPFFWK